MTIKLYAMGWQDRSDRVRWLLEEMKVAHENIWLNKKEGQMNTPEFRAISPMGRVPVLVDGDVTMWESGAICMYLADKYAYGTLAPKMEDQKLRAEYTKWMVWSVGSLECVIARMFTHVTTPEETKTTHQFVKDQCEILKLALNPILEKQDYILSSGFSAADIMLAAVIPGAQEFLVEPNPAIKRYMERCMNREAAVRANVF